MDIKIVRTKAQDIKAGLFTKPCKHDIFFAIIVFAIYSICSLILGLQSGFFTPKFYIGNNVWMILMPVLLLIVPAIPEELVFRGLLIPHKRHHLSARQTAVYSILSIVLFVLWHPFTALTIYPSMQHVFLHPIFLTIVLFLAIACTITYIQSGCLWIPIFIHWATVMVWMYGLGGRNFAIDLFE